MGSIQLPVELSQHQHLLELRLLQLWDNNILPGDNVVEKLGPIEAWLLKIGEVQFFLNPIIKEWMFLDPIHDSWIKTGIPVNTGIIYTLGKEIFLKKTNLSEKKNTSSNLPVTQQISRNCPTCQQKVTLNARYCINCGTHLEKEA